jgi:plasmid maintenance system antidote protein VapI
MHPAIAARLGKALGDGAGVRLRMRAVYDAWRVELSVDVSRVRTIKTA